MSLAYSGLHWPTAYSCQCRTKYRHLCSTLKNIIKTQHLQKGEQNKNLFSLNRMRLMEWRRELIPQVRWCISKRAVGDFQWRRHMVKLGRQWMRLGSTIYMGIARAGCTQCHSETPCLAVIGIALVNTVSQWNNLPGCDRHHPGVHSVSVKQLASLW